MYHIFPSQRQIHLRRGKRGGNKHGFATRRFERADGSIKLAHPVGRGVACMQQRQCFTGADRLMVIAARDNVPDPPPRDTLGHCPTVGEMAGHALDILFNDNLDADHERMARVNETVSLLDEEARRKTPLRVIRTMRLSPSQDLREIAKRHAHDMPPAIRLLMRSLGSWSSDGRLISYLLFEASYTGALIDLGYADTMRQAEAVKDFLEGPARGGSR